MYDYIVRNTKSQKSSAILAAILIVIGLVFMIYRGSPVIGAALLALGILAAISVVRAPKTDDRTIESLKASGKFDEAEKDFDGAASFCEDFVRIGERFIYRKQYPVIIDISLIERIYAIKSTDNSGNSFVNIGVSLQGGRTEKICAALGYPNDPWVDEIVNFIMSKNPAIVKE